MLFGLDKKVWFGLVKQAANLFGLGWEGLFGLVKETEMMFGSVIEAAMLFCCLDIRVAIFFNTIVWLFNCLTFFKFKYKFSERFKIWNN